MVTALQNVNSFALGRHKWSLQGTGVDNFDLGQDYWSQQSTEVSSAATLGLGHGK